MASRSPAFRDHLLSNQLHNKVNRLEQTERAGVGPSLRLQQCQRSTVAITSSGEVAGLASSLRQPPRAAGGLDGDALVQELLGLQRAAESSPRRGHQFEPELSEDDLDFEEGRTSGLSKAQALQSALVGQRGNDKDIYLNFDEPSFSRSLMASPRGAGPAIHQGASTSRDGPKVVNNKFVSSRVNSRPNSRPTSRQRVREPLGSPTGSRMCLEHGKLKGLICVNCQHQVCETCALFGEHKGHDVRQQQTIMEDIRVRMEKLMDTFQQLDEDGQMLQEPEELNRRENLMEHRKQELVKQAEGFIEEVKAQLDAYLQEVKRRIETSFKPFN